MGAGIGNRSAQNTKDLPGLENRPIPSCSAALPPRSSSSTSSTSLHCNYSSRSLCLLKACRPLRRRGFISDVGGLARLHTHLGYIGDEGNQNQGPPALSSTTATGSWMSWRSRPRHQRRRQCWVWAAAPRVLLGVVVAEVVVPLAGVFAAR